MLAYDNRFLVEPTLHLVGRRPYTPSDDAYLIALYGTTPLHAIATALGRDFTSVQQRSYTLIRHGRLTMAQRFYNHPWTEEDDEYLAEHIGRLSDRAIGLHLRRSVVALRLRAKRKSLAKHQNIWCAREVGRLFGVDAKTICRWVDRGWLKAKRAGFHVGLNRAWSVDEASIERFIKGKGWAFDWRRMPDGDYYRNLACEIDARDPWLTLDQAVSVAGVCRGTLARWCHEGLEHRYRPKATQRGPREGYLVVRRSVLLGFVEARMAAAKVNRLEAARNRKRSVKKEG